MLYGLITLLLMLVFIGVVIWTWSSRRKKTYEKAARMPLEEDNGQKDTKEKEHRP